MYFKNCIYEFAKSACPFFVRPVRSIMCDGIWTWTCFYWCTPSSPWHLSPFPSFTELHLHIYRQQEGRLFFVTGPMPVCRLQTYTRSRSDKELVIKQSPSDDIICTKEVCMWHQTRQLEHHDLQIRPIYKTIMARKVSRRNEAHGGSPTQASGPV